MATTTSAVVSLLYPGAVASMIWRLMSILRYVLALAAGFPIRLATAAVEGRFISAWLFTDPLGRRVLVDPGPADTIPLLIRELESLTDGIDLILLTHIHLDHAGGLGQFCSRLTVG